MAHAETSGALERDRPALMARRRLGAAGFALAGFVAGAAAPPWGHEAHAQEVTRRFDIEAKPLAPALVDFARQAGLELFMADQRLEGLRAQPLSGDFSPQAALERLLQGSGYEGVIENGVVRVRRMPLRGETARARDGGRDAQARDEETVIVVGTNIRGVYPSSSPVEIFEADDIARMGVLRTEQFIDTLTQNLATRTQFGPGSTFSVNREGVNGVDLRGLGVGTSLVLLNGRRLPLASEGQTADLSFIPLIAVSRVEVLTDGASAIYGSDAIGGVLNFVLRHDVEGSETRIDYGSVTEGGMRAGTLSHSTGVRWNGGDAFIALEAHRASALERDERPFSQPAGRGDLSPLDERFNVAARFSTEASDRLSLHAEMLVGNRHVKVELESAERFALTRSSTETRNIFINTDADYTLTDAVNVSASLSYRENDNDVDVRTEQFGTTLPSQQAGTTYSAIETSLNVGGRLWRLRGGPLRFSVGGGQIEEDYWAEVSGTTLGRTTQHVYAEVFAPLLGSESDAPWTERLEVSFAARYTDYEDEGRPRFVYDFGDHISPKVGLLWAPTDGLDFRASFSESFRAPSLSQLDPAQTLAHLSQLPLRGELATVLALFGPRPLEPETARTHTFGFDLTAPFDPRLRLRATYFNIDYIDRIAGPDPSNGFAVFADPDRYPDILFSTNSAELIETLLTWPANFFNLIGIDMSDPAAAAAHLAGLPNFVVYDNRLRNLAQVQLDGFDFDFSYSRDTRLGELSLAGRLTYVSSYREKISPNAPTLTAVDTALRPVDLRGRVSINLDNDRLSAMLAVNYVDDYRNPYGLPPREVDSWTTWDARIAFNLGRVESVDGAGLTLSFTVQNIFDEDPPYVASSGLNGVALLVPVGFDPANADPVGRFLSVQLTKRW